MSARRNACNKPDAHASECECICLLCVCWLRDCFHGASWRRVLAAHKIELAKQEAFAQETAGAR
jgi:hypothetical protein